jgi:hypothetical protein
MGCLEETMAAFYQACGSLATAEAPSWRELELAERRHMEQVQRLAAMVTERPARFEQNPAFKAAALRSVIAYVDAALARLQSGQAPTDLRRLLSLARDLEQSILESRYPEVVKTADLEFQGLARGLVADTAAHKGQIMARLAALPAQP